jgi:hydroxyethylthiazole kinase-like uncharacterized protein yjeF
MKFVSAEEMREIDRISIQERGIPSLTLMERAGEAVASLIIERISPRSAAVVTGKGNNAGDGFVVARLLHQEGVRTKVFMLGEPQSLTGDALHNFDRLPEKIEKETIEEARVLSAQLGEFDCTVDAILGTGVKGGIEGLFAECIGAMNHSAKAIVAVDIPSGLSADESYFDGTCVHADYTVTFGLPKIGMVIHPGVEFVGDLHVADLGFPKDLLENPALTHNLITARTISEQLPPRPLDSNKRTFGYVLIIAGSVGMTGAAILAAQAAGRSGAGLIYVATPASLNPILEVRLTEAVTIPLACGDGLHLDELSLDGAREWIARVDVVALGPGIGQHSSTKRFVQTLLAEIDLPLILDADGINALTELPQQLKQRRAPTLLTPHPGEMSRLIKSTPQEVQRSRIQTARSFAREHNVVLVLKGARTLIAEPSGQIFVNPTGNTGLAKGGSGDVLTGLIAGFAAQGLPLRDAAVCGVYLHGVAGDLAAAEIGARAMIPSDVITYISKAFRSLESPGGDLHLIRESDAEEPSR